MDSAQLRQLVREEVLRLKKEKEDRLAADRDRKAVEREKQKALEREQAKHCSRITFFVFLWCLLPVLVWIYQSTSLSCAILSFIGIVVFYWFFCGITMVDGSIQQF